MMKSRTSIILLLFLALSLLGCVKKVDMENARTLNEQGIRMLEYRRYPEAIESFQKAIAVDSKYTWAYVNLGMALHGAGNRDEAIAQLQKALELQPDLLTAHYMLGTIYRMQNQGAQAIEHFKNDSL